MISWGTREKRKKLTRESPNGLAGDGNDTDYHVEISGALKVLEYNIQEKLRKILEKTYLKGKYIYIVQGCLV